MYILYLSVWRMLCTIKESLTPSYWALLIIKKNKFIERLMKTISELDTLSFNIRHKNISAKFEIMSNLHVHIFWNLPTLYCHVILFTNLIDLILVLLQADACRNQCKTLRQKYEDSDLSALVEACLLVKFRQAGKAVQLLQVANSYLEIPYTLKYFS